MRHKYRPDIPEHYCTICSLRLNEIWILDVSPTPLNTDKIRFKRFEELIHSLNYCSIIFCYFLINFNKILVVFNQNVQKRFWKIFLSKISQKYLMIEGKGDHI